jgi:DNA-directed RNA polymerase subunit RPC12/RpoP
MALRAGATGDEIGYHRISRFSGVTMAYPIKTCFVCGEEFELKPGKPGFANRCPECSEPEAAAPEKQPMDALTRKTESEANAARRQAMRDLLYRKDS